MATALALLAAVVGRVWKKPALRHGLWLLVLLKLVTPPLLPLPVLPWKGEEEPTPAVAELPPPPAAPVVVVTPPAEPAAPVPSGKDDVLLGTATFEEKFAAEITREQARQNGERLDVVGTLPPADAHLVFT